MWMWDQWKKGFDIWEDVTAKYLEQVLQSPALLQPAGSLLTVAMKAKAQSDKAAAQYWSGLGLPTRRDQERTLHALNQLQSRISDLEEQIHAIGVANSAASVATAAATAQAVAHVEAPAVAAKSTRATKAAEADA